jgi:hypothetical protein
MTTSTLNIHEIPTPNLTQSERESLLEALQSFLNGDKVELSVKYNKVTNSKPRIEGEDYTGLLGIDKSTLIGTVKKIAKSPKTGWYVLLDATLTRKPVKSDNPFETEGESDDDKIGWTSIKGPGIKALKGTRVNGK